MSLYTIKPNNIGKEAVAQIILSKAIICNAKEETKILLQSSLEESEEIKKRAYSDGLLLGAENAKHALVESTMLNAHQKKKIEKLVIDLTTQVLSELIHKDVDDLIKNSISKRIGAELDAYCKQINVEETRICLEISVDTTDDVYNNITEKYPYLSISKIENLDPKSFILKSPYGEIESDPIAYVDLISAHLKNSLNLDHIILKDSSNEQL